VERPRTWSLEELAELPQSEILTDIHCVTRWSKLDVRFSGVLLKTLLDACQVAGSARFVSFVARSERRHSSSLPLPQALQLGTLLATHYEGRPLPEDHGGPLRGVVPGRYFYKSVKWIETIELLEQDQPGYWESEAGYHNHADPWLEQRYIAGSISRREAAALVERRDFSGRDLLSINVASLDLRGLRAGNALLRNANFECCNLCDADFRQANLSNARFRQADLRGADFASADLEGADFAGADLRGVSFHSCSLFGTTFADVSGGLILHPARFDGDTRIDRESMAALTGDQQRVVDQLLKATGKGGEAAS
jgi:hypothetical protein